MSSTAIANCEPLPTRGQSAAQQRRQERWHHPVKPAAHTPQHGVVVVLRKHTTVGLRPSAANRCPSVPAGAAQGGRHQHDAGVSAERGHGVLSPAGRGARRIPRAQRQVSSWSWRAPPTTNASSRHPSPSVSRTAPACRSITSVLMLHRPHRRGQAVSRRARYSRGRPRLRARAIGQGVAPGRGNGGRTAALVGYAHPTRSSRPRPRSRPAARPP